MVQIFSLLFLAFAISLDSFSVGFTYGLRKMMMPVRSILIIAGCSALSLMAAVSLGHGLERIFSPEITESIGGLILVMLGAWVLLQFFRPEKEKYVLPDEKTIVRLEIKSIGLVIHILRKPLTADFDNSGVITGIEAVMLGLALSLDSFGAGIGAAMLGYNTFSLAFTAAVMSSLFIYLGIKGGRILSSCRWVQKLTFIPGVLLIIIGIWRM